MKRDAVTGPEEDKSYKAQWIRFQNNFANNKIRFKSRL